MAKTTLFEKESIRSGLVAGKSYQQLSEELGLSKRVVRKWGQVLKKKVV
jgi:hypothetical protein